MGTNLNIRSYADSKCGSPIGGDLLTDDTDSMRRTGGTGGVGGNISSLDKYANTMTCPSGNLIPY